MSARRRDHRFRKIAVGTGLLACGIGLVGCQISAHSLFSQRKNSPVPATADDGQSPLSRALAAVTPGKRSDQHASAPPEYRQDPFLDLEVAPATPVKSKASAVELAGGQKTRERAQLTEASKPSVRRIPLEEEPTGHSEAGERAAGLLATSKAVPARKPSGAASESLGRSHIGEIHDQRRPVTAPATASKAATSASAATRTAAASPRPSPAGSSNRGPQAKQPAATTIASAIPAPTKTDPETRTVLDEALRLRAEQLMYRSQEAALKGDQDSALKLAQAAVRIERTNPGLFAESKESPIAFLLRLQNGEVPLGVVAQSDTARGKKKSTSPATAGSGIDRPSTNAQVDLRDLPTAIAAQRKVDSNSAAQSKSSARARPIPQTEKTVARTGRSPSDHAAASQLLLPTHPGTVPGTRQKDDRLNRPNSRVIDPAASTVSRLGQSPGRTNGPVEPAQASTVLTADQSTSPSNGPQIRANGGSVVPSAAQRVGGPVVIPAGTRPQQAPRSDGQTGSQAVVTGHTVTQDISTGASPIPSAPVLTLPGQSAADNSTDLAGSLAPVLTLPTTDTGAASLANAPPAAVESIPGALPSPPSNPPAAEASAGPALIAPSAAGVAATDPSAAAPAANPSAPPSSNPNGTVSAPAESQASSPAAPVSTGSFLTRWRRQWLPVLGLLAGITGLGGLIFWQRSEQVRYRSARKTIPGATRREQPPVRRAA